MPESISDQNNKVNTQISQASGFSHCFDVGYAKAYGLDEAIMIHHFQFFINANAARGHNFHEGRFWTYDKLEDFVKHFPYWTAKIVRRILASLIKQGVIIKGNFNTHWSNVTKWYAFKDQHLFIRNIESPNPEIIPDSTPKNEENPDLLNPTNDDLPKWANDSFSNGQIPNDQMGKCIYDTSTIPSAITTTNISSLKVSEKPDAAKAADERVEFSSEVKDLGKRMVAALNQANPHWLIPKNLFHIMSQIHKMITKENRKPVDIWQVFDWTINDHFWMDKISKPNPAKYLRDKFGQLAGKMNAKPEKKERKFAPSSDQDAAMKQMEEFMARAI